MSKFQDLKYFNRSEFDSPDIEGSGENMSDELLLLLDEIREKAGFAFKINSGYRTESHNKKVGGVSSSSHTKGLAVDIACSNSRQRAVIIQLALSKGINRIGIAKSFIHLDIDKEKSPLVVWLY